MSVMEREIFTREIALIGEDNYTKLKNSRILLFGLGGVGGYVLEALVRAGVGYIDIVDNDVFSLSNMNRQILATTNSIGKHKVDVAIERAKDINCDIIINGYKMFVSDENINSFQFNNYDYVIDAIDTISAKLKIIEQCNDKHVKLISCMGTGNRLDATNFIIEDIYKTKNCKVSKIIRKKCKELNIPKLTVLYSPTIAQTTIVEEHHGRHCPASISYCPAIAGLLIAQYVIQQIIDIK